ncbi:hypothetical protein J5N97_014284 [Dioscorea zingiberensis]|uniref:Glutamate synthase n=1 Tax=Dioscorea zingiberensis TaxID=325984 RepID=A0A9D5HJD1_9LILI|nr:hypothetical protein J5N97_014284 [Dioscorea zingiberensis]
MIPLAIHGPQRRHLLDFIVLTLYQQVGVLPMDESKVVMKGRLGPGMMITVDLESGQVYENTEVKKIVASSNPYKKWLIENMRTIKPVNFLSSTAMDNETILRHQQAFGYSSEDVQMVIETMAAQGKEPTFCMGDDIPLAVLSQKPHMLYDYFKQRFAQVTNPAIDPLREGLVMSLRSILVILSSPVLNEGELDALMKDHHLNPQVLHTFFDIQKGIHGSIDKAIKQLCEAADDAVRNGSQLLVLSDRSEELNGLRMSASIVADTAQCFSTHQFACLIGYGASAVCPYLALETCRQWRLSTKTVNLMRNGKMPTVTIEQAQRNFCKAVKSGLLKILSKMGISLLSSYCGAQIFEIYGLGQEIVDLAFCGSVSKIGGLSLDELARESLSFWVKAFSEDTAKRLENFGFIQHRPGGEYHGNNPEMSKLLHKAVRQKNESAYSIYQQHLANRPVNVLRDLLEFRSDRPSIPVAIAIAMNRLGGKSNTGEGGEDPIRWSPLTDVVDGYSPTLPHLKGLQNGDTATSAIKQVASGRFGVTPTFLVNADQLEIKIAQGAKPGEGGQLPGKKVNPKAKVSVKLVAEAGIGTVASGVAKGNADIIQISGHDGGTGASPREELRARFPGVPGDLVNYFLYVAEEVRGMLAQLGYEKLDDIIGRTDLFTPRHISLVKTQQLDLSYILSSAGLPKWSSTQIRNQEVHSNGPVLDDILLSDPEISEAIEHEKEVAKSIKIYNVDRAVCGRIAGVIAKKYGDRGFAGQLNITFTGSAGQSFGCFLTPGMNVRLVGEANDYVGKGMAGGELVVAPVENTGFCPEDATIVGNTCLYGATGGQIFVRGKAGERFAVRNSLAQAVVEGTGDHCCIGNDFICTSCQMMFINFVDGIIQNSSCSVNKEIVRIQRVNAPAGQMQLKSLIEAHVEKTGSIKGATILNEWEAYLPLFWQLVPPSEEDTPEACAEVLKVDAGKVTLQSA